MFGRLHSKKWNVCFDELISALQKGFRRGEEKLVQRVAAEIDSSGYGNAVWNRLEICASEDFSVAQPMLTEIVKENRKIWAPLYKKDKENPKARKILQRIVTLMARVETSRISACMAIASMMAASSIDPEKALHSDHALANVGISKETAKKIKVMLKDAPEVVQKIIDQFAKGLISVKSGQCPKNEGVRKSGFWADQIYLREPQKKKEKPSSIDLPTSSTHYTDLLWKTMIVCAESDQVPHIKILQEIFLETAKKDSFTERVFMFHAILAVVLNSKFANIPLPNLTDTEVEEIYGDGPQEIPEWAIDKHTTKGRQLMKEKEDTGVSHFWREGVLETKPCKEVENIFYEEAMEIYLEEEKNFGTRAAKTTKIRQRLRAGSKVTKKRKSKRSESEEEEEEEVKVKKTSKKAKSNNNNNNNSNNKSKKRKKQESESDISSESERSSESESDSGSESEEEPKQKKNSKRKKEGKEELKEIDTKKKNSSAMETKKQKILQGLPHKIGEWEMTQEVRAQTPCGGKPSTFYAIASKGEEQKKVLIKGPMSPETVGTQRILDTLKPLFPPVKPIGMVFVQENGEWFMISDDHGTGVPYPTIKHRSGLGELVVVDKTQSGAQMLRTWIEKHSLTEEQMMQLLYILLFRWIFGVSDTHNNNILYIESGQYLLSVDETNWLVRETKGKGLLDHLYAPRPPKKFKEEFGEFLEEGSTKEKVVDVLGKWGDVLDSGEFKKIVEDEGFKFGDVQSKARKHLEVITKFFK